jgi:hypothetical protein
MTSEFDSGIFSISGWRHQESRPWPRHQNDTVSIMTFCRSPCARRFLPALQYGPGVKDSHPLPIFFTPGSPGNGFPEREIIPQKRTRFVPGFHRCIGYRNPHWQSLPKSAQLTYLSVYGSRDKNSELWFLSRLTRPSCLWRDPPLGSLLFLPAQPSVSEAFRSLRFSV